MRKSIYSEQGGTFRAWLKEQRVSAGLSMRDVAQRLDVHFQFISKIEKGERRLDVVEFVLYCEALGANPHDGIAVVERSIG